MRADPELGKLIIIRPFEVMRVDRLTENAFDADGIVTLVKTVTLQRPPRETRTFDPPGDAEPS